MKRGLTLLTSLFSINLVSAYYYGYGSFSLGSFIESNWENIFLLGILLGSFALLNLGILRGLKDKSTSAIISFIISIFITAGVYFSNINIEGFFYNIGFSSDVLYTVIPLLILGAIIFMGISWGFGIALLLIGLFLITSSFFVYEAGLIAVIGVILSIAGAIIWRRWPKRRRGRSGYRINIE